MIPELASHLASFLGREGLGFRVQGLGFRPRTWFSLRVAVGGAGGVSSSIVVSRVRRKINLLCGKRILNHLRPLNRSLTSEILGSQQVLPGTRVCMVEGGLGSGF